MLRRCLYGFQNFGQPIFCTTLHSSWAQWNNVSKYNARTILTSGFIDCLFPITTAIIKFDLNCLQKVLLMEKDVKVEPGPMSNSTLDGYTVLARSNKQNPVNRLISFFHCYTLV